MISCMQQLGKPVVVIRTDDHGLKKSLARVQAPSPELASLATAHEL